MIDKQPGNDGTRLVTFRLPTELEADTASVVGEFNDWSPDATPMERGDDGFAVTVPLEHGRAYRFRYVLDGERWENDWAADGYVANEYGSDDSVVDLTEHITGAGSGEAGGRDDFVVDLTEPEEKPKPKPRIRRRSK